MFDDPSETGHAATAAQRLVRAFLIEHETALAKAALLLGGGAAMSAANRLIERVDAPRADDRRTLRDLRAMHRLLTLDAVGDPDRIETALFAELDPAGPLVEDFCRLADRLGDLLDDLARLEGEPRRPPHGPGAVAAPGAA